MMLKVKTKRWMMKITIMRPTRMSDYWVVGYYHCWAISRIVWMRV